MMASFVQIHTFFGSNDQRNIEYLSPVYLNKYLISNIAEEFIKSKLSDDQIKNKKILIKPNWVNHNERGIDELCLRTNDNFLLAILEPIIKRKPKLIIIGDAPIQRGQWDKIVSADFNNAINKLRDKYNVSIEIKDFRRTWFSPDENILKSELRPDHEYVIFDTGKKSYLEPITDNLKNKFRVTKYNHKKLIESHNPGTHKYCIIKDLFDSDIVISLPKLKTHQKTGITGALKNIVGMNGDKDYLPHHRLGGQGFGGDCYPGKNYLRYWSELMLDKANENRGKTSYPFLVKLSSVLWRISFPKAVHSLEAGWYGNDTTWRMVQDLNLIASFGTINGLISAVKQREIYSICDGIIAGQGDGPLKPDPLPLGVMTFSNSSAINDIIVAEMMGFDFKKFPLLSSDKGVSIHDCDITLNYKRIPFDDIKKLSCYTEPPKGWKKHLLTR